MRESGFEPLGIGGYVLAGGRSSRMGRDKARLALAGSPLLEHALGKLRPICESVAILSNAPDLEGFGEVVKDGRPDCGPMSGLEAALAHSVHDWNLILPVDLPFLPASFLHEWAGETLKEAAKHPRRLAMFTVDGVPQPTLVLIHRDLRPYLTEALEQGRYKVLPVLKAAADDLAAKWDVPVSEVMIQRAWPHETGPGSGTATDFYFMNLNTPADFAEAEKHADLLDAMPFSFRGSDSL